MLLWLPTTDFAPNTSLFLIFTSLVGKNSQTCYIDCMTAEKMICFMCKGTMNDGFSTFTVEMGKCIVIVKNVPSQICGQCGDTTYNSETAKRLEEIVRSLTQPANTEIAVATYTKQAA